MVLCSICMHKTNLRWELGSRGGIEVTKSFNTQLLGDFTGPLKQKERECAGTDSSFLCSRDKAHHKQPRQTMLKSSVE